MRIVNCFLGLLICMLTFSGCQEERLYSEKGSFTVMLEDDLTDIIATKSTPTELGKPLTSQFQLEIRNINTEEVAYNGLCDKTYYEVNTGTYDLTATYGSNEELAFDAPYYKGELRNQKVEASGKSVAIPCSVANALVSVKYTNENVFNTLFSSYGITVTCGDKSLDWSSEKAQQSIYFKEGSSVSFVFNGILKDGSKEVSFPITEGLPKTFAAKDHYMLKLTYQAGQSSLSITTEHKSSSINETVPQSWLPAPQLESTDFSNTKVLSTVETEKKSAIIQMKVARPLQDMQIGIDFQDTQFTSLNKTYLLSELSNDEKTALENAGIILPKIGDSAPVVNLTDLTEKLQTINGGTTTVNNIYIKAKANDRWSHSEESEGEHYNINIQRPTFTISVQEGNVWSKEFTIDEAEITTGNPDIIKSKLNYQYSEDGTIWFDCNNNLLHKFDTHPENKSYKIRAIYRDIISNIEPITLETPTQISNSSMEEWTPGTRYNQPYYQPWTSTDDKWWDTNNNQTMPSKYSIYPNYKCFPTTTYTDTGHNGRAAVIRSVAINGANSEIMGAGSTRGILAIGESDNSGNINEGHSFKCRPTKLNFYYTYESYDNERFGVYLEILNQEKIIASSTFESDYGKSISNYSLIELPITYTENLQKATSIRLSFYNVAKSDSPATRKITVNIPAGNYKIYGGSVLSIDDISLTYDK